MAAAGTAGRPSGKREATERGKFGKTGTVGSGQQLGSSSSGGCGRAELLWMANGEFRKRTPRGLGMTGWRQQGLREGRAAVDGIGLIQGDREATEHRNDWHGGKRAAFGKRRRN